MSEEYHFHDSFSEESTEKAIKEMKKEKKTMIPTRFNLEPLGVNVIDRLKRETESMMRGFDPLFIDSLRSIINQQDRITGSEIESQLRTLTASKKVIIDEVGRILAKLQSGLSLMTDGRYSVVISGDHHVRDSDNEEYNIHHWNKENPQKALAIKLFTDMIIEKGWSPSIDLSGKDILISCLFE